jgi:hypothetical protein
MTLRYITSTGPADYSPLLSRRVPGGPIGSAVPKSWYYATLLAAYETDLVCDCS